MNELKIKLMGANGMESGVMNIDLDAFMSVGQITKVRKLIKIIYNSQNPEIIWDFEAYIDEKLNSKVYYNQAKFYFNEHVNDRDKVVELEEKVSKLKEWLDGHQYTKNTMWFNDHQIEYKKAQQELKAAKAKSNFDKRESNKYLRQHQFYEKAKEALKR